MTAVDLNPRNCHVQRDTTTTAPVSTTGFWRGVGKDARPAILAMQAAIEQGKARMHRELMDMCIEEVYGPTPWRHIFRGGGG